MKSTFKTKTGYCHIFPSKIILSNLEEVDENTLNSDDKTVVKFLVIYSGFALMLFYLTWDAFQKGAKVESIFLAFLGVLVVYGVLISLNNSSENVIDRNKIKEVHFKKGIPGLTRARFEVFFENDKGKQKKRLILLPGSIYASKSSSERTLQLMKDEGLIEK